MDAELRGDIQAVKTLLAKGEDVNEKNSKGWLIPNMSSQSLLPNCWRQQLLKY